MRTRKKIEANSAVHVLPGAGGSTLEALRAGLRGTAYAPGDEGGRVEQEWSTSSGGPEFPPDPNKGDS